MASKKSSKKAKAKKIAKKVSAKKSKAKKAVVKKAKAKKNTKKVSAKKSKAKKSSEKANYGKPADDIFSKSKQNDLLLVAYGNECEEIISNGGGKGYYSIAAIFAKVAEKAEDESNEEKRKIFHLLSSACEMRLSSVEDNDPFSSYIISNNRGRGFSTDNNFLISRNRRKTFNTNDFSENDIEFFSKIINYIENIYVRARLADIVWIRQGNKEYAKIAINAYLGIPADINEHPFMKYNFNNQARALTLALLLEEKNVISLIKDFALKSFLSMYKESKNHPYDIAEASRLLLRIDTTDQEKKDIATKLEEFGADVKKIRIVPQITFIFRQASLWYKKLGNEKKSYKVLVNGSDVIKELIGKGKLTSQGHRVLSRGALSLLKEIPPNYILEFGINKRVREFKLLLEKTKEDTSNRLPDTTAPLLADDIRKQVDEVIKYMQSKDRFEALSAFANLSPFMNSKMLKDENEDSIATITHLDEEGKGDKKKKLINRYRTYVKAITQTLIIPALKTINNMYDKKAQEYRSEQQVENEQQDIISESVFGKIAQESSIVHDNSVLPFAKGLFAGYESDYITALSILTPQVEAMVRYHLDRENVSITKEDSTEQAGLGTLLGRAKKFVKSEDKELFGENSKNIIFELISSFCNEDGANLRNEVSHGRIKEDGFGDAEVVYAWWLVFSMTFKTCDEDKLRSAIENSPPTSEFI